jgi:hypothetical protein
MSVMLDILISAIMGGMLLLNIISAQSIVTENSSMYNGDVLVQEMLIRQAQIVEGDIRNMGYGVPPDSTVILDARDTTMTFLMDADRNGTVDTIKYFTGPVTELAATQNEMDRYLHRLQKTPGGSSEMLIGVVTYFHLRYMPVADSALATPVTAANRPRIKDVEVSMEVQNPYALYRPQGMVITGERNALYSTSYWQQTRLASQNFRR